MQVEPLSKNIYNEAKELGITEIILKFSGGSDEGYLDVELLEAKIDDLDKADELQRKIEDWAWEVYSYSGAGEGSNYGDTITYNLETNEVSTEEWYHVVQTNTGETNKLEIAEEE